MNPGDMVFYTQESRGGYGYTHRFPAVVVKVNAKSVRIRLGVVDLAAKCTRGIERTVKAANLSPRLAPCEFEAALKV